MFLAKYTELIYLLSYHVLFCETCCQMQFGSLEEFQQEFADISQEEQVSRLHKMLAPHLLRSTIMKLFPVLVFEYLHDIYW